MSQATKRRLATKTETRTRAKKSERWPRRTLSFFYPPPSLHLCRLLPLPSFLYGQKKQRTHPFMIHQNVFLHLLHHLAQKERGREGPSVEERERERERETKNDIQRASAVLASKTRRSPEEARTDDDHHERRELSKVSLLSPVDESMQCNACFRMYR